MSRKRRWRKSPCGRWSPRSNCPNGADLGKRQEARQEYGQLEGRAYTVAPSPYGWASNPTDNRVKIEWVVRAQAGQSVQVTARHERAGIVRAEITLP